MTEDRERAEQCKHGFLPEWCRECSGLELFEKLEMQVFDGKISWKMAVLAAYKSGAEAVRCEERSYVPQKIAQELLKMLEGAGFGKPGTANTLLGMTKALIDARCEERKRTLEECIKIVMEGRTMTNFAHVPSVVRALEWVWMDLSALLEKAGES